jgi:hypothetical protein
MSNCIFFNLFCQFISGGISHNVPAVHDVFAARIRALRSKDHGRKNVGEQAVGMKRSEMT